VSAAAAALYLVWELGWDWALWMLSFYFTDYDYTFARDGPMLRLSTTATRFNVQRQSSLSKFSVASSVAKFTIVGLFIQSCRLVNALFEAGCVCSIYCVDWLLLLSAENEAQNQWSLVPDVVQTCRRTSASDWLATWCVFFIIYFKLSSDEI